VRQSALVLLLPALLPPRLQDPPPQAPLAWETLEARMDTEAKAGFSGAVLVVRGGKIVLDRGYGLANREEKIEATKDTIFAIGSTPIDFTKAGILLLIQDKKLSLDETLPAFFENVPEDKRAITVGHLMTGRSGLRDFHDVPTDRDPDHSWIDRGEAVKRIFAQKLLFEPGKGQEHSHSAWGLLAAILEIKSGKSYPEFTRERLFAPAGMRDTGFFGEPIPKERLAIGYGERKDGETNAPPSWGKTSWLVMGSGGMVSTTGDLHRWNTAMRAGRILSKPSAEMYFGPVGAVFDGGDMYGFEILYTEGPDNLFFLVSNSVDRASRERFEKLGEDLVGLVQGKAARKFGLGVEFAVQSTGEATSIVVKRVLPGRAAERDGLRADDVLIAIGGEPVGENAMAVLAPYLESGKAIPFTVKRGNERIEITVKPDPR
jgi:CubicO group peptidase (beta-lactamase class C family)